MSSSAFATALHTSERDALGLDATTPQSLHADVLDAAERSLQHSLAASGASADAPRPPAPPSTTAGRGALITPGLLAAGRAMVEAVCPAALDPAAAHAAEAAAAAAAEAAWRGGGAQCKRR